MWLLDVLLMSFAGAFSRRFGVPATSDNASYVVLEAIFPRVSGVFRFRIHATGRTLPC